MKILIVSSWYPPIQSGSSFYAEGIAMGLVKRGHSVVVVTTHWDSPEVRSYEQDGIQIHSLPAFVLPRMRFLLNLKIVPISYTPANIRRVLDIVREFKPDIIHQVNHIFDTVFLSALVAKRTKTPLACSITTPIQHPNPLIHRIMRFVDRGFIGRFAARRWNSVICLDREVLRYIQETYGKTIASRGVVIAYGIRENFTKAAIYESQNPEGSSYQIVMVGHIHALRNPTNLVRALPMIQAHFPNARLVFAGRVQLQQPVLEAEKLGLGKSIDFLGELSHDQINNLLHSSHVYAAWGSGVYTGLGTACIEAMLCGIPVVIDQPEDLFGDGDLKNWGNIVLVNRDDVDGIGESIIRLLGDDSVRRQIGINGREYVLKHLQWERIVEQVEQVYQRL
jgi:glycosyltransferase involved in cell wall biosynthesis